MKNLASFLGSSLSRSEMKSIKGGCYVDNGSGGYYVSGLDNARKKANKAGVNYCCDSCYKATWCYDPD